MQVERSYPELLRKMKSHFSIEQNAEMVAMITAAEYQYVTLTRISESKLFLPSVASEAITTVNEIAKKVLPNIVVTDDSSKN
jgi:hypothetical protein